MAQFADDILRFRIKVQDRASTIYRKVVIDLFGKIVERTPVDTGRARSNWMLNVGPEPRWSEVQRKALIDLDRSLMMADVGKPMGLLANWKMGETTWISNGLPYIRVLEYGLYPLNPKHGTGKTAAGFSTQAIGGMVSVSCAEFGDLIEEVS